MDPKQKPAARSTREDDVDLGQLFNETGGALSNFFSWLTRVFNNLGHVLLLFLFYLKRNLIWLLVGAALGLAVGLFQVSKSGISYNSKMTVKANFNSSRNLYGSIDFFNALISNRQTAQLAKIFSITPAEAASLNLFEATPVESEVITADLYKERFLNLYHNTQVRMDTFWVKTISYKDFKNSLTKYDYPLHEIKVVSNNAFIFPKIQQGFVNYVSGIESLQQMKQNGEQVNREEIALLESSLQSLDTLRSAYTRRLISGAGTTDKGNTVTMLEGNMVNIPPELELYNKMLQLKDELKQAKNEGVLEKNILEIYSPFAAVGKKESFLEQKIVRYTLYGLLLAFIITALLALNKTLATVEAKYRKAKIAAGA